MSISSFAATLFRKTTTTSIQRCYRSTVVDTTRPFRVLGLQQVAIGCENRGPLDALWKDVFGLKVSATKRLEKENVEEDIVKLGPPDQPFSVELDLMTPIDPTRSPKVIILFSSIIYFLWRVIFGSLSRTT